MLSWIERIQKKSAEQRRRIMLFLAILLTTLIVVIWITTLDARFFTRQNKQEETLTKSAVSSTSDAYNQFFAGISAFKSFFYDSSVNNLTASGTENVDLKENKPDQYISGLETSKETDMAVVKPNPFKRFDMEQFVDGE